MVVRSLQAMFVVDTLLPYIDKLVRGSAARRGVISPVKSNKLLSKSNTKSQRSTFARGKQTKTFRVSVRPRRPTHNAPAHPGPKHTWMHTHVGYVYLRVYLRAELTQRRMAHVFNINRTINTACRAQMRFLLALSIRESFLARKYVGTCWPEGGCVFHCGQKSSAARVMPRALRPGRRAQ